MSRVTMSTGGITFTSGEKQRPALTSEGGSMKVVVLGDFSGRVSCNQLDASTLAQRKIIEVDRDNFDEVFASLKVKLNLPVCDDTIHFNEFDDLHPDYLYERVSLFDDLRKLNRQLNNPDLFDRAAEEIETWERYQSPAQESSEPAVSNEVQQVLDSQNMLDAILSSSQTQMLHQQTPQGIVNSIIKDVVAPYVEQKADSRKGAFLNAVSEAASEIMRKICHASAFQNLEASWRSLYMLVRQLETGKKLKLYIVDVAKQELLQDIKNCSGDIEQSGLYKLLIEKQQVAGGKAFNLISGDFYVEDSIEDINLAATLAVIADELGAAAICGGSEKFAGCESLALTPDVDDWHYECTQEVTAQWNAFKQMDVAKRLALAAPRFMLRLPYGKKTSPLERFPYEELPRNGQHKYYLWGNSAYIVTLMIAQAFSYSGGDINFAHIGPLEGLPLHVYDDEGESTIKPCAEILITDKGVERFTAAGLLCVRSMKDKDSVIVPAFYSVYPNTSLLGPW